MTGTPNLPIKKKIFPKKVCLVKSVKEPKIRMGDPGASKTIGLKLSSENHNLKKRSV
jgi:hypothetical protein